MLLGLRDGLRSGDLFDAGSRRYADPASFLLTAEQWEPQRVGFCTLVGKPAAAADALAMADDELHTALADRCVGGRPSGAAARVMLRLDRAVAVPPRQSG